MSDEVPCILTNEYIISRNALAEFKEHLNNLNKINFLAPPQIPPPPKNFYKFQPKKVQHVPNVIPKGRWNQYLFGGTNKPTTPAPPAVLKSFEGTVCGRFEVSE